MKTISGECLGFLFHCRNTFVFFMEGKGIFRTVRFPISHIPTLFLVLGYPLYWVELYFLKSGGGRTTFLAWTLFIIAAAIAVAGSLRQTSFSADKVRSWITQEPFLIKIGLLSAVLLTGLILVCGFYAAMLPPHLMQETDTLIYHYPIPRQHLISHSFSLLPWNAADLFLLPVQFALAPFWFATSLPNKFPQFLFVLGLLSLVMRLAGKFSGTGRARILAACAVLSVHGIVIQIGTGMLDLILAYLFFACLDSVWEGRKGWAVIEFVFFFWAKPLMPFQITAVAVLLWGMSWIGRKMFFRDFRGSFSDQETPFLTHLTRKDFGVFILMSFLVAGPFLAKSYYYSGTLFYPLGAGMSSPVSDSNSLDKAAVAFFHSKDNYGHGRSLGDFLSHFWLLAVPEKGVNNAFDYPLGLGYLLVLGPFLYFLIRAFRERRFCFLPFLVVISWALWWCGPQQSRFLYIPVIVMVLSVLPFMRLSKTFVLVFNLALALNLASMARAYQMDWGKRGRDVLREEGRSVLALNKEYFKTKRHDVVPLAGSVVTFAEFPASVADKNLPFFIGVPDNQTRK